MSIIIARKSAVVPLIFGFHHSTQFGVVAGRLSAIPGGLTHSIVRTSQDAAVAASNLKQSVAVGGRRWRSEYYALAIPSTVVEYISDRRGLSLVLCVAVSGRRVQSEVISRLFDEILQLLASSTTAPIESTADCADWFTNLLQDPAQSHTLEHVRVVFDWFSTAVAGISSSPAFHYSGGAVRNSLSPGLINSREVALLLPPLIWSVRRSRGEQICHTVRFGIPINFSVSLWAPIAGGFAIVRQLQLSNRKAKP